MEVLLQPGVAQGQTNLLRAPRYYWRSNSFNTKGFLYQLSAVGSLVKLQKCTDAKQMREGMDDRKKQFSYIKSEIQLENNLTPGFIFYLSLWHSTNQNLLSLFFFPYNVAKR